MHPFLCCRCFHVSLAEKHNCPHCDSEEPGTVLSATSYSAIPEYESTSPGYYVIVKDASTQVTEEDLVPLKSTREASTHVSEEDLLAAEPTRETSTRVTEEDLLAVEPTREGSTRVTEEDLVPSKPTRGTSTRVSEEDLLAVEPTRDASTQTGEGDLPVENARSNNYENCFKRETSSQNPALHDSNLFSNANQNGITYSHTNEGKFPNQSCDTYSATTLLEVLNDKPSTSKQACVGEQSLLGENETRSDEEFLKRQERKEPVEGRIMSASSEVTDSMTLESKHPNENLLSNFTEKVKARECKNNVLQLFSFWRRGNPSVNKCFEKNFLNAISVTRQKPQAPGKLIKKRCEKCGRYFIRKWTFRAHMKNYCNRKKILMRRLL